MNASFDAAFRSNPLAPIPSGIRGECVGFVLLLAFLNMPLGGAAWGEQFTFLPAAVAAGEWWRLITHPFVHVSWYHLLLDASAFFLLYAELDHWTARQRAIAVIVSAASSLGAALASPDIFQRGLCGLSGVAHGLAAIAALQMIHRKDPCEHWTGWGLFTIICGKGFIEATTGEVALGALHFGLMGVPNTLCHAGGIIGGLIVSLGFGSKQKGR